MLYHGQQWTIMIKVFGAVDPPRVPGVEIEDRHYSPRGRLFKRLPDSARIM